MVIVGTVALAVLWAPALAAAADRSSDQQIADDSVLTIDDVPAGFNETTVDDSPDEPPGPACTAIKKAAKALDAAPHTEVEFRTPGDDSGSALINNQVSVFASAKRAKVVYAAYAARSARNCLTTTYERIFLDQINDSTAEVKATASRYSPDLGDAAVGYEVEIVASAQGESETFYVDVEVARVGRGIDAFGFFNSGNAPPSDDVVAMTDAGVGKLESAL
jgi:hypothetical protein